MQQPKPAENKPKLVDFGALGKAAVGNLVSRKGSSPKGSASTPLSGNAKGPSSVPTGAGAPTHKKRPSMSVKELSEFDFTGIEEDLARFQQDDLVRQALGRGVELKGYSAQVEQELKEVEMESVKEYVQQSSNVVSLHTQIQACDMILARMQEMLLGFQADLGGISEEIRHLQEESRSMSVKLQNRREVETHLQKFLDKMVLPPDMIGIITGKEVNDAYIEYIVNLKAKLAYVMQNTPAPDGSSLDIAPVDTAAGRELGPKLEKLRLKAVGKARDYLLGRIAELKKPKTHVQMVQRHQLMKYRYLMEFLYQTGTEVGEEVRNTYAETMGKVVFSLFRAYHTQLQKLVLEVANKSDLIAVEESSVRGMFTTKVDLSKRGDAFSLADRDKILDNVETEPIIVHIAQAEGTRFPYEALMRSVLKHLLEAATCEFLFTQDFFKARGLDTFNVIFARTLSLCLENLENYLFNCYDAIALLIMIKTTIAFRGVMQRRRIAVLDSFFDRITMLLWPRFKALFDANLKSVRTANAKKLGNVDLHPHYVSRRYAEFTATCLALHASPGLDSLGIHAGGDDMLLNDVRTLTREVIGLLQRLAERQRGPKEKAVFLINNCDQVLNVFHERRVDGEERQRFEDCLSQQREIFVEEELKVSYGRLIHFVRESEVVMSTPNADGSYNVDIRVAESLVRDFAATWKTGIESINTDVMNYFSNFRNGMEILKQVLTQMLLYYTRFQEIVKKAWAKKPPPFAKDLVSTAAILVEIRKYSRTI